jgi:hypothetical protein
MTFTYLTYKGQFPFLGANAGNLLAIPGEFLASPSGDALS